MPVEDSVTEDVVALPVHDEHFLDYVVSLIDEFAPGSESHVCLIRVILNFTQPIAVGMP